MPQSRRSVHRMIIGLGASLALAIGSVGAAPSPATAAPPDQALFDQLTKVMGDSRVKAANTGALVWDATGQRDIYGKQPTSAITPASNTKILTAAAALHTLGPDYRFKTEVISRSEVQSNGTISGSLYLKGYGDPTTLQSDLTALAQQVKDAGITTVQGNLVVDGSHFDTQYYNPNWSTSYESEYYAAQISGLTLAPNTDYDAGTVIVTYSPGAKGKAAKYTLTPASAAQYVKVVNKTTTGAKGSADTFTFKRGHADNTITLSGSVPTDTSATQEWVAVHRPSLYAGAVFRDELAKVGVSVAKPTVSQQTPADGRTVLATDHSMKLSQLMVPFLKLSNNSHAEHLTKAMGATTGGRGTWAGGITFIKAYAKRAKAPAAGLELVDGSGLARANKITSRQLVRVLEQARSESWFLAFRNGLPIAGDPDRMRGGTLTNRMRSTPAQGNAKAKTGSLTGVTALSGYVRGADNRLYVFAMMSEYSGTSPRPVEDTFVVTLAKHRR